MIDKYILFRGRDIPINDKIIIHHPTLEEIFEFGESQYLTIINSLTLVPFEFKAQLFDMGIDYESLSDYNLFLLMFKNLQRENINTSIVFNLKCNNFEFDVNDNNQMILIDKQNNIVIDEGIYYIMVDCIRSINHLTRNNDKAGNEHAKQYLIEKDKRKIRQQKYKKQGNSQLLNLVSAMTNSKEFKYSYDDVWNLPVYVFYDSVARISKIKNIENIMMGAYTGNIKLSEIPEEQLNWLN